MRSGTKTRDDDEEARSRRRPSTEVLPEANGVVVQMELKMAPTEPDLKESPSEARSSSVCAKNFDSQESFAWIWALQMFRRFTPEMAVKQHELLHSVPQHGRT